MIGTGLSSFSFFALLRRGRPKIKARFLSEPSQLQFPRGSHYAFTTFPLCVRSFPSQFLKQLHFTVSTEQRLLGQALGRIGGCIDLLP